MEEEDDITLEQRFEEAIRQIKIHEGWMPLGVYLQVVEDLEKILAEPPVMWRWRHKSNPHWSTQMTEVQPQQGYIVEALYRR